MQWRWPWQKVEKRSAMSGFTAELIAARANYIAGRSGIGELTATVQTCVGLWENAFAAADVTGAAVLDRRTMALAARALALRGEAVFLIREGGLVPCADWDVSTRNGKPSAYRVSISEANGGRNETVLAAEVLHFRIGSDVTTPWAGSSPLRRSSLTGGLLEAVEASLAEVFEFAPIGSQIVPFPESRDVDLENLGRGFKGRRGRVLLRESVAVSAAGGPAPASDWKPQDVTPDLEKAMTTETLEAARNAILGVYFVLPCLLDKAGQGPAIRESQRHLATYGLQPIGELIAEEASAKLGAAVSIDVLRPLQAFDAGGAARAFSTFVGALAQAKEAGLDAAAVAGVLARLDWEK
ncbi:hypothetical protein AMST5_01923 [freshwater sediment metagenome]|uniref:Phage portal protein n=1 Tax=freshwater sediment metagenome TaxID=556182 RepID=A0AA48LZ57_9ZZZZ